MKIAIKANERVVKGTGASRRLRHSGKIPGILYGNHKDAKSIEFDNKELLMQFKHEAFHASILTLEVGGEKESVILRDYQLDPVKNNLLHVDFQRINEKEKLHVKVPFHFINEETAPGVKLEGGIVSHIMTEVDIACLPKDLPQYIEVDLGALNMGESIHLSQIQIAEGIELTPLTHGNDAAVTSITKPKVVVETDPVVGEEGLEASADESSDSESSEDSGSDSSTDDAASES
ncbi:MAG: 50S ribosomal protein L25/general stress protein Ctc [Methylophilaceae bacterium]|nr:50S ribosomal protein L25/general stress protein Ctc [Methylophilaceae bacterium]MBL6726299.1 50S ribosomal protein L25/general stress protein Ctc [Methylophilaceae bacterium]MBL6790510.1 50S ribosomal protein L25/general stress protein Ctc [Methylophilaceae bacterium]